MPVKQFYFASSQGAKYCDKNVCFSVCLSNRITRKPHGRTLPFLHVACGRDSVLFWRRCDTLYTSGFVDDVVFSLNVLMARRVYSRVVIEYDRNNGRNSNWILLNDEDRQILTVSCAPGMKSAVYDYFWLLLMTSMMTSSCCGLVWLCRSSARRRSQKSSWCHKASRLEVQI